MMQNRDKHRCKALTKKGERCRKVGRFSKGYCPIHASQAEKNRLNKYATTAGAAAATFTVVEKIIELIPYFMAHVPHHGKFQQEALNFLEHGDFHGFELMCTRQSRLMPPRTKKTLRALLTSLHQLTSRIDKLPEIQRQVVARDLTDVLENSSKKGAD
jgi:hypothetical protein